MSDIKVSIDTNTECRKVITQKNEHVNKRLPGSQKKTSSSGDSERLTITMVNVPKKTRSGRGGRKNDIDLDSLLNDLDDGDQEVKVKFYNPKTGQYEYEGEPSPASAERAQVKVLDSRTGEYQPAKSPPGIITPRKTDVWVEPEGGLKSRETRRLEALEKARREQGGVSPASGGSSAPMTPPPGLHMDATTPLSSSSSFSSTRPNSATKPKSNQMGFRTSPQTQATGSQQQQQQQQRGSASSHSGGGGGAKSRPASSRGGQGDSRGKAGGNDSRNSSGGGGGGRPEQTKESGKGGPKVSGASSSGNEGREAAERARKLEEELMKAKEEARAAEDIMDQMRLQAMALHQEKQSIRQKNDEMNREMQMLQERVAMAEEAMKDTDLFAEELMSARDELENEKLELERARAALQAQELKMSNSDNSPISTLESLSIEGSPAPEI